MRIAVSAYKMITLEQTSIAKLYNDILVDDIKQTSNGKLIAYPTLLKLKTEMK